MARFVWPNDPIANQSRYLITGISVDISVMSADAPQSVDSLSTFRHKNSLRISPNLILFLNKVQSVERRVFLIFRLCFNYPKFVPD